METNDISKLHIGGIDYNITDDDAQSKISTINGKIGAASGIATLDANGKVTSSQLPASNNTTYQLTLNGTTAGDSTNGTQLGSFYAPTTAGTSGYYLESNGSGAPTWASFPASLPASDVSSWAKAANKPSYAYSEIGYSLGSTTTSNGGTLSLDGTVPVHVVTVSGNISALELSTNPAAGHSCHVILTAESSYTVLIAHDSTDRICPDADDVELTIPAGGYIEVDFLNADDKIFVRGI